MVNKKKKEKRREKRHTSDIDRVWHKYTMGQKFLHHTYTCSTHTHDGFGYTLYLFSCGMI